MFGPGLITCAQYAPKMMHTNNSGNGCDYYKMADLDFISKDGMLKSLSSGHSKVLRLYDPFEMVRFPWSISNDPFHSVHST